MVGTLAQTVLPFKVRSFPTWYERSNRPSVAGDRDSLARVLTRFPLLCITAKNKQPLVWHDYENEDGGKVVAQSAGR